MAQNSSDLVLLFVEGWMQILLYGINAVLFGVSIFLLQRRKDVSGTPFLLTSTIFLFICTTMTAVATIVLTISEVMQANGDTTTSHINSYVCSIIIYINLQLVDLTALTIITYRCYVIWNRGWKVVVVPVIMILVATGIYYAEMPKNLGTPFGGSLTDTQKNNSTLDTSMVFTIAVFALDILSNSILTCLIAGRIWWFKRRLRQSLGQKFAKRRYDPIIAITLESGLIIPVFLIIFGSVSLVGDTRVVEMLSFIFPQIIAIPSLLIIVRAGLGLSVEGDHITIRRSRHDTEFRAASNPELTQPQQSRTLGSQN